MCYQRLTFYRTVGGHESTVEVDQQLELSAILEAESIPLDLTKMNEDTFFEL